MTQWTFTKWYENNKGNFNEKRRSRYNTDPEYRQRVLEMNRKNREKRQSERSAEEKARQKAVKVIASPAWKEFEADEVVEGLPQEDGAAQKFLTIGAVAKATRRSTQTIRLWEKQGLIPETPYRNSRDDRLYTPAMVLEILNKVKELKELEPVDHKSEIVPVDLKVKMLSGEVVDLRVFRVGVLAQAVGRTVLTLEQMERKGVFPKTPLRDPQTGHRYYTAEMIEAVKAALDDMGGARLRGEQRKAEFHSRILNAWAEQGIIGVTIVPSDKEATNG